MVIVIDASNIRGGGGVTHLVELLKAASPETHGFHKVYVCSCLETLRRIEDRPWLTKQYDELLDKGLIHRIRWQFFRLKKLLTETGCDILFVPGGTYFGGFKPFVAMSQNLLPFEWKELSRYGFSKMALKLIMLRFTQSRTFKRANGIIFLTDFARSAVIKTIGKLEIPTTIVPHGINVRFNNSPRHQNPLEHYNSLNKLSILYVSSIDVYKHQVQVIKAMTILHKEGLPIYLNLVGPAEPGPLLKLRETLAEYDPNEDFIRYHGVLPYETLSIMYNKADLALFASSCETFGQIVTEAMSAGLPVCCSNMSALPEVLGNAGIYFNPEVPEEIAQAIKTMIKDPVLRMKKASEAFERSKSFSWSRCSKETFEFLEFVATINQNN